MKTTLSTVASLSDDALLAHVSALASRERQTTAGLVASLGELDARRLYLGAGCSSLFTYCTQVLHLSEHAAYGRIEAARCARKFPQILERLATGSLTLTTVCLLAPVITDQNADVVLERARHRSKREVEHLVAAMRPQPGGTDHRAQIADATAGSPRGCDRRRDRIGLLQQSTALSTGRRPATHGRDVQPSYGSAQTWSGPSWHLRLQALDSGLST